MVTARTGWEGEGAERRLWGSRDHLIVALGHCRQLGLLRGRKNQQWRGGAGLWRGVDVPIQGRVCVSVCVPFTGPEQQIMHPHMCMSAREHLCEHLYLGERM